jgi:hypothetical protein
LAFAAAPAPCREGADGDGVPAAAERLLREAMDLDCAIGATGHAERLARELGVSLA